MKPASIDVRGRIDRLENLVRSLISQESMEPGSEISMEKLPGHSDSDSAGKHMTLQGGTRAEEPEHDGGPSSPAGGQKLSIDTRSTHWDAILHDVRGPIFVVCHDTHLRPRSPSSRMHGADPMRYEWSISVYQMTYRMNTARVC